MGRGMNSEKANEMWLKRYEPIEKIYLTDKKISEKSKIHYQGLETTEKLTFLKAYKKKQKLSLPKVPKTLEFDGIMLEIEKRNEQISILKKEISAFKKQLKQSSNKEMKAKKKLAELEKDPELFAALKKLIKD